ncbi:MAG: histidine-type phosphatase [Pseudomonadota bacterium]|nr:histidine-type phosphatase [Pseudomonadota bacterium]
MLIKPCVLVLCLGMVPVLAAPNYQTKTPYQPQQDMASYEAVPTGYFPVSTQMLARHGSRGLTGFKADLALYNMWLQAQRQGALTPLGRQLGPDILALMQANAVLGFGVPGITKPGYGNETQQGIAEHAGLARRMVARLPALFADAGPPRQVVVVTSGKDRAVDSGTFFVQSLLAERPNVRADLVYPPSRAPAAEVDHASRPMGTDRFLLYFHKLGPQRDLVADPTDPLYATYVASQAYQAYGNSAVLADKEAAVLHQPRVLTASRVALARLFHPAFLDRLDRGQLQFANTGTRTFSSADGKFSSTLTGDGSEQIASSLDAALALYALYCAAADMRVELPVNFTRYVLPAQADVFAWVNDAQDFYRKGPGMTQQKGVTSRMAGTLRDDFLQEADAVAGGNLAHRAKLRFAHAETIVPFAALLQIPGMSETLPEVALYSYANSPWRGAAVAPMAANIQWDMYRNDAGTVLLRMLYNERETDFMAGCDAARIAPRSHFYAYAALRTCLSKARDD